ncbi:MAG: VOC family protein [Phycisphaerae bacterium]|nr:VOC family protein [Phycisphaerae bacterium]
MSRPPILRVSETVLYAADLGPTADFYARVLGLRELPARSELSAKFRLPDRGVLLVFDPRTSALPGREVPSHGAVGPGHVAFDVPAGCLQRWREELERRAVPIEREVAWDRGGRSIYVRDPAGNSVELVEGSIWPD